MCHHSPPQCNETSSEQPGKILFHGTIKSAILDVSASFWTHVWVKPTLEYSGQTSLLLQRQLRGYKTLDPTTKHQKYTPENLFLHIYKRTNTHPNTAIGQLIAGKFSLACGHASTRLIRTHILQKGAILFYRKRREISHDSGTLHLVDKVSLKSHTHKNGVKDATVTQWRTAATLCPVRIWAEIIIRLE